jgi:hemoglobin-like flavoprotein
MKVPYMDRRAEIERSLEIVAERIGDPAPAIYARLFAQRPEYERLFALDPTGAVRGNMLATALDAILDIAGPNAWGMNFLLAERVNHSGVNVPPTEFLLFVHAVRDTVRDVLADDWTEEMSGAWGGVLAQIEAASAEAG